MSEMNPDELVIDPNSKEVDDLRPKRFSARPGPKVFHMVAMTRDKTDRGTHYADFRMVAVADLRPAKDGRYPSDPRYQDRENDVGCTARLRFHGTEGGMRRLGNFAKTNGYTKPVRFSPYGEDGASDPAGVNDDVFEVVRAAGYFVGKVEVDIPAERDGSPGKREFAEIVDWRPFKGEIDPGWAEVVNAAAEDWERIEKEQEARKARGRGKGGGAGGRGGGGKADQQEWGF